MFYVGGRSNGMIGTVAGTIHDDAGELRSFCAPPLPEIMGLAVQPGVDTIWYTDLTSNGHRLLQVDADLLARQRVVVPGQEAGAAAASRPTRPVRCGQWTS